jgi:hypothetical protein
VTFEIRDISLKNRPRKINRPLVEAAIVTAAAFCFTPYAKSFYRVLFPPSFPAYHPVDKGKAACTAAGEPEWISPDGRHVPPEKWERDAFLGQYCPGTAISRSEPKP